MFLVGLFKGHYFNVPNAAFFCSHILLLECKFSFLFRIFLKNSYLYFYKITSLKSFTEFLTISTEVPTK